MQVKLFEIRDSGTFIPAIAIKPTSENEAQRYLMSRSGYGRSEEAHSRYVLLARLSMGEINYDAFQWPNRTMHEAHKYIKEHFDDLMDGAVVDVQFILGETSAPAESEASLLSWL